MSQCGTPYVEKARALEFLNSQRKHHKTFFSVKKKKIFSVKICLKYQGNVGFAAPLPTSQMISKPIPWLCCVVQLLNHVQLLHDLMDCSPPGSSVHVISQARIPEQVAISSPRDLLGLGIEPISTSLAGGCFTTEPPAKPQTLALSGF